MSSIKTFFSLIKTPLKMIQPIAKRGLLNWVPDSTYLKLVYKGRMGKTLDLENPKTFNEKMQWLKINDHNPEYIGWVDKIKAKDKVADLLGDTLVVPTIGTWDNAKDIDFSILPSKCILKCNHDQGSTIIYTKESNKENIIKFFEKRLNKNPYPETREWAYQYVKPQILCEPFLADNIIDYKFFCCNGKVQMINIGQKDHDTHITHVTFLDRDWNKMPFQRDDFPAINKLPQKPEHLCEMIQFAEKISKDKPFVRVDFYYINKIIYFSEFTLYPTSGFIRFKPVEGDEFLGELLHI